MSDTPQTAPQFLDKANSIMTERATQYDQPGGERSMGRALNALNAITGRNLTEPEGWLLLQVLKNVRQWQNPDKFHRDSAEDGVAYSALKAEALARAGDLPGNDSASRMTSPSKCTHLFERFEEMGSGQELCWRCKHCHILMMQK
jgi:hypothetical protein